MVRAEVSDDGARIVVETLYRHRDLMREVPGAAWSNKDSRWKAPLSWGTCVILRGIFGEELEVGPKLTEWATAEYTKRIAPSMALREAVKIEDADTSVVNPTLLEIVRDW